MNRQPPIPRWVWLACLGLACLKLWVTASQTVFAIGFSPHDDSHFVTQALHLLRGDWLGPYDNLTLIKGPFFPAWIALTFLAGIPLLLSVQLLYAASCWLFSVAARSLLGKNTYIPILFTILLFNPESAGVTRVVRQLITPSLTLLVAACGVRLLLMQENRRGAYLWAAGLGISFAALWLTREEGMVVVPFLLFSFGAATFLAWRTHDPGRIWSVFRMWIIFLLVWASIIYSVAATNFMNYGVFAKTEFDSPSFKAAYGALSRVRPPEFKPMVPITKKTRRLIYPVSPAFKELRPYLEGRMGDRWQSRTIPMQDQSNTHEIIGSWWEWALRDAVSLAGYYQDGRYPEGFYSRLAREVNDACSQRRLDCYGPRATLLPVWHMSYIQPLLVTFSMKLEEMVAFRGVGLDPTPSIGTTAQLVLFRELTGNRITPPQEYYLEIEAVAANAKVQFVFKDQDGTSVPFRSTRGVSPDLYSAVVAQGEGVPNAMNAHYSLSTRCSDQCSLEIWVDGEPQEVKYFSDLEQMRGVVKAKRLVYRVLSFEPPPSPFPEAERLSGTRVAILHQILRTYQMLHPIMAVVALLTYLVLTTHVVRQRSEGKYWFVLTSLAILATSRIAMISLFHLTSVKLGPVAYLEEAYPIMLAFVGLSCLAAPKALALFASRDSRRGGPAIESKTNRR